MNLLEKVSTLIAFSIKVYLKCNCMTELSETRVALTQATSLTNKIHNARTWPRYLKPQILKDSSANRLRPFMMTKISDIKGKAVKTWYWSRYEFQILYHAHHNYDVRISYSQHHFFLRVSKENSRSIEVSFAGFFFYLNSIR